MVSQVPSTGKQLHPLTAGLSHQVLFCKAAFFGGSQPLPLHGVTLAPMQDCTFASGEL